MLYNHQDSDAGTNMLGLPPRHGLVGPADLWGMKREFQISFLLRAGLHTDQYLLDLGCGVLRGGIPIIDYLESEHYTGVEVRHDVLAEGRLELAEAGLTCKEPKLIYCERLSQLDLQKRYDVIWAFQVLIHISDPLLDEAVSTISRHLSSEGVGYATVNTASIPDGSWQGFPVVHRSIGFYEKAFDRHGLQVEDIGALSDFGHHHPRLSSEAQRLQRMLKIKHIGLSPKS